MTAVQEVLDYWFGSGPPRARGKLWFTGGEAVDREIHQQFGERIESALAGKLSDWSQSPHGALALIVLLDQFTRNLFRGSARAFSGDSTALKICLSGIESGFPDQLHVLEASFFFMPLEHSESMEMQNLCVRKFEELLERSGSADRDYIASNLQYAISHRQIIRQFNRYPHRNKALERTSTTAEIRYLAGGGTTFGQ